MPFTLTYLDATQGVGKVAMWENLTGKRLYLNEDHTQVVLEDSEHASFVLCGPGARIPMEDAVKYGLITADEVPAVTQPELPEPVAEAHADVLDAIANPPAPPVDEEEDSGLTITKDEPEDKETRLGYTEEEVAQQKAVAQSETSDKAVKPPSGTQTRR